MADMFANTPSWFVSNWGYVVYVTCVLLGIGVINLFASVKFAEPTVKPEENDLLTQLLPRYLATRTDYARGRNGYLLSLLLFFGAFSIIGPRLLEAFSAPQLVPFAPMVIALLLFGLIRVNQFPFLQTILNPLQTIEWQLRDYWHQRAYIPAGARAAADMLRTCGFDFSAYRQPAVLTCQDMLGVNANDFDAQRGSIEYGWARLSCVSHELSQRRQAGQTDPLDGELLDRYARDLDAIVAARREMAIDIARYREEKKRDPYYENDRLRSALSAELRRLNVLIACAVRVRLRRSEDPNAPFRPFGFVLPTSTPQPANQDLILVGLTVMTFSLLVLGFAAIGAAALFGPFGVWHPSVNYPKNGIDAFIWALSTACVHGTAILTAELMRGRRLRNARWFVGAGAHRQINVANYVKIGLACAATGMAALFVWCMIMQQPSLALLVALLPYALLPAATGAFYAWHLDNAELGIRPPRRQEIGLQAGVTALCGLFGTVAWLARDGDVASHADFIILVMVWGAVIGASLASWLPAAAANRRRDPVVIVRNARIASLRDAAFAYFVSPEEAESWLSQPNPALRNLAPRDAAADVELCVRALGLLHQPAPPAPPLAA
jgi:hypothetical protein